MPVLTGSWMEDSVRHGKVKARDWPSYTDGCRAVRVFCRQHVFCWSTQFQDRLQHCLWLTLLLAPPTDSSLKNPQNTIICADFPVWCTSTTWILTTHTNAQHSTAPQLNINDWAQHPQGGIAHFQIRQLFESTLLIRKSNTSKFNRICPSHFFSSDI